MGGCRERVLNRQNPLIKCDKSDLLTAPNSRTEHLFCNYFFVFCFLFFVFFCSFYLGCLLLGFSITPSTRGNQDCGKLWSRAQGDYSIAINTKSNRLRQKKLKPVTAGLRTFEGSVKKEMEFTRVFMNLHGSWCIWSWNL